MATTTTTTTTIKFLCSYDGAILPRITDGRLRYFGGHTRILAVPRSISFSDLSRKLSGMCGRQQVSVKCQLPREDMDALVSVTCDEDLANMVEEYDRASPTCKIRVFLMKPKQKKIQMKKNYEDSKVLLAHHHHHHHQSPSSYSNSSTSSSSSSGSSGSGSMFSSGYCIPSCPHVCY